MWTCNCMHMGKGLSLLSKLSETKVDAENICTSCGYYAVWEDVVDTTCTIFRRGNRRARHFASKDELAKFLKDKGVSIGKLRKPFLHMTPYSPQSCDYVIFPWKMEKLTKQYEHLVVAVPIYLYNVDEGFIGKYPNLESAAKSQKESKEVAQANLDRNSITTKKGNIYTKSKTFDIQDYLKIKHDDTDINLGVSWREDITSYNEEELGVSYKEDTYGTWKDLLYS